MSIKMLMFELRNSEKEFLNKKKLEDFDITFFTESLNENTIKKLSQKEKEETVVISSFITSNITAEIIQEFPNLRFIATRSTGFDHIDIAACTQKNITVLNVDNYGATAVTQFIFG